MPQELCKHAPVRLLGRIRNPHPLLILILDTIMRHSRLLRAFPCNAQCLQRQMGIIKGKESPERASAIGCDKYVHARSRLKQAASPFVWYEPDCPTPISTHAIHTSFPIRLNVSPLCAWNRCMREHPPFRKRTDWINGSFASANRTPVRAELNHGPV